MTPTITVHVGDCLDSLRSMPSGSVHMAVTSPPYFGLRDYGVAGQIGLEETPESYVAKLVAVFREVRRVLRPDGTLWLNLGDTYSGSRETGRNDAAALYPGGFTQQERAKRRLTVTDQPAPKNLLGIPWRVAFALQADGWYLRQDIIWHKPNPMPSSVRDRCTTAHEYVFLLSASPRYYFDAEAIKEPATDGTTRNKRDVWTIAPKPYKEAHFACYPPALVEPCVLAGTSAHGACAHCGAPFARQVERTRTATRPGTDTKVTGDAITDGNRDPERHVTATRTVGWSKPCSCPDAPPVPCVVLDPFGGSGTTAEVAYLAGRSSVLCELNPDYARLIEKRLEKLP
jgi:DNA modification methylase